MSFYINGCQTEIQEQLAAEHLVKKVPRFARGFFDPLEDVRTALVEAARVKMGSTAIGMVNGGWAQRIVSTPVSVWAVMMNRHPEYFQTKKGIYDFARKYPQYRVGKTIIRNP